MRWLVDGMNVVGARPDGWWRDRTAAMRRLVAALEPLTREAEVTVVFDGRPREVGAGRVAVAFAPGGRDAADAEIARRVESDAAPGDLHVVTSDRALADRVRAAGATVVGAGAFAGRHLGPGFGGDAPG